MSPRLTMTPGAALAIHATLILIVLLIAAVPLVTGEGVTARGATELAVATAALATLALCIRPRAGRPFPERHPALVPGLAVRDAMVTDYRSLTPEQSLDSVVDHVRSGVDQDFPVTLDGRLVGLLRRNDLLLAFANLGRQAATGDAMVKTFRTVEASESLDVALDRFQAGCRTLPVVDEGRLVGLLSLDDAAERIRLRRTPAPAPDAHPERVPQNAAASA